jgi:hypothetical protein
MRSVLFLVVLAATVPAHAQNQWALEQSTLTWHITHPMHEVDGTSHGAKGKGTCANGECNFLIAVPVNTFHSGDSNRDLHTLQVVRGAEFPMVVVRTTLPQAELNSPMISADLEVQFAGQTVHYSKVQLHRTRHGKDVEITGTIPATCSAFKIERPSFLTVPIHDEIPVAFDVLWRPE